MSHIHIGYCVFMAQVITRALLSLPLSSAECLRAAGYCACSVLLKHPKDAGPAAELLIYITGTEKWLQYFNM